LLKNYTASLDGPSESDLFEWSGNCFPFSPRAELSRVVSALTKSAQVSLVKSAVPNQKTLRVNIPFTQKRGKVAMP
jgi:hypothetical protein